MNIAEKIGEIATGAFFSIMLIASPAAFITFLILAIRQYRKIAKEKVGKAKAVIFTAISSYYLLSTIVEIAIIAWFSYGIAHM